MTHAVPWPLEAVGEWMPLWKGLAFFLVTFVSEDAATIGAGLLLAAGAISWPVAFVSCYLGIWSGDVGLYALARFGGRKWFEKSSFKKYSTSVERSEKWFAERGLLILIFTRCSPGTRMPTYLAAGFLRLPLPRFLAITGVSGLIWTLLILWLAQKLGSPLIHWLAAYRNGTLILLLAGIALVAAYQLLRRGLARIETRQWTARLARWRHWEFWPAWLFYPPVALYYVWLALKYRGVMLPSAANPGIFSGGLVGESKLATLSKLMAISPELTAETELIPGTMLEERLAALREICARRHFCFPFILKPDLGQRGAGIKLIRDEAQAMAYLERTRAPLLVQRYAPGPYEAGIFYYRFPHEPHGKIFAITEKIFPEITADGTSTVSELVWRDPRARLIADKYLRRFASRRDEVLPAGAVLKLVEAGNHVQGCIFRDGQRLWTPELEARFDEISRRLDGFFFGRYDIRFASEQDLRAGENFVIIELNGAAAEAGNIYDARNTLWSAYRTLFRQWQLVFAIGAANRRRGARTMSAAAFWKSWRNYRALAATYPAAD